MKKYIVILILISLYYLINFNKSYAYQDCKNYIITPKEITTKNFTEYINKHNFKEINYICSYEKCLKHYNLRPEKEIKIFENQLNKLANEEIKIESYVKGYPITKISINNCKKN